MAEYDFCNSERINHIKCEVKSCKHHCEGNTCNASYVQVKGSGPSECDTLCATYTPNK